MKKGFLASIVAPVLLLAGATAHAQQDPCALLAAQSGTVPGVAGGKMECMKSGANVICEQWSADRKSKLGLIVEPPAAARGLAMRRMLTMNAKEPGMKAQDEASLGASAFSFATKQQASFSFAGKSGSYTLSLNRDAGIAPADLERLRAIARQLAAR